MSAKKQYQYQIDVDPDAQEIEMQANQNNNVEGQDMFKDTNSSSTSNNKKKRGAARLKAKKSVQSANNLEQKQDSVSTARQNQSAIINFNQNTSASTVEELPFMRDFSHRIIKKDPNYQSFEKTVVNYNKGQEIQMKEQSLYKIKKTPKRTRGIIEYLTQNAVRYILIEKGMIYTLRKVKNDKYQVSSSRELSQLFKVYEDRKATDQLRLCFLNKERDPSKTPLRKLYNFGSTSLCQEFLKSFDNILKLQGFSVIQ